MPTENEINQTYTSKIETPKKKWEDYTIQEKKESFLKHILKEVAQSIKGKYAPFTQPVEKFQRAYNPYNGLPFTTLNSLILDIKQKQHNYKENAWISLKDARFLKADKNEINAIFNDKDIPKAQVHYIKTFEMKPVYEMDKKGNKIPNTQIVKEKIPVDPTLETRFLYNIEVFKTIDKSHLKPINKDQKYRNYISHQKDFDPTNAPLIFQDLKKFLFDHTAGQIITYLKAQNENTGYIPPKKSLNEIEKIQVEKAIDEALKNIAENKNLLNPKSSKEVSKREIIQDKTKKPKKSKSL
ncbi:ArdC-like ssDNA-binding domain-containing protein [Helicobacter sp. 11S03491-1]|uniref:ArdC-like ssDNA-binding domain-containing protein n=1 Tax=Helicobacter sp. 11S03491-1 TaxID=1476196 RepID=UPI000BA71644|nr:ArdC-like ssDNA-binding domain-containing protein [Helicobacter sp. 11S03491-1]PAF41062.1 hypothetical protein BKH45_08440 [Helicobacter sp. 11S03491-1]